MTSRSQKQKYITCFFKKSDNPHSNRSSTSTESTQPGGATACQPGGATACQPGGATACQPGGATACQPGGATACQPGGATACQPGGATACQPGGAMDYTAATQTRVKRENNYTVGHSHHFIVKFRSSKHRINCHHPRTVLEAIKLTAIYKKMVKKMKGSDDNIVIQLGEEDRKYIIATHFPCFLIEDGKCLIVSEVPEQVEVAQHQYYELAYSSDKYCVFYIDTVGGLNTKQKRLFRNNALRQFKYLCVYGEKAETVEEALKRDGRFVDNLHNFTLSDNEDPECDMDSTQFVDNLNGKQFKICFPRNKRAGDEKQQEKPATQSNPQRKSATRPVLDVAKQSGVRVSEVIKDRERRGRERGSSVDTQEIYGLLREQFPDLRKLMQNRFPGDSFQEALKLKKENFGKIQQSFSEVHRVRKLLKLGESVCKVFVKGGCEGTGFVLFDNFILTNGHLFKDVVEGDRLMEGTQVFALFNYDDPEPSTNYYYFNIANSHICYGKGKLDYAVLQLNPEVQKPSQTGETEKLKVPPGLLENFGPVPENGEACLIGHPAGGLKKMDPTCIIEKEKRGGAISDHLDQYKENTLTIYSIANLIKNQGIENILMGGTKAEIITYNTFMYHGSSGSPVFDAHGRVFGLHTAGYTYGFPNHTESVIEYAQSVLTIFKHFVSLLKERGDEELLGRVEKEAERIPFLKKLLNGDCEEDMKID